MKYIVTFTYMDGEELIVEIPPSDMAKFIGSMGGSEVYFNQTKGLGVWIAVDKLRYFNVEHVDENGDRIFLPESATEGLEKFQLP